MIKFNSQGWIIALMLLLTAFTGYGLWWANGQVADLDSAIGDLEATDNKEIKLIGDLTDLVGALNQDGKDLRKVVDGVVDEAVAQRREADGRWAKVDQYAGAMARYYAVLVLIELDSDTMRDSLLGITDVMAFDPMLSAMWEEVLRNPDTFYLFDLVLRTHFYRTLEEALGQPDGEAEISSSDFNRPAPGDGVS
jgi:hypothetical protein